MNTNIKRHYQENKITVESILNELYHLQEQYNPSLDMVHSAMVLDEAMNSIQNIVDGLENGIQLSPSEKHAIYKEQQEEYRKEDLIQVLRDEKGYSDEMIEELSDEWFRIALNYYDNGLSNLDHWKDAAESAVDCTFDVMFEKLKQKTS